MLALKRFYVNPFADPKISVLHLLAFTEDHLGKLVALNAVTGAYNEMIVMTQAAFDALGGRISDEVLRKGIRMARTAALRELRGRINRELSRVESRVHAELLRGSPEYVGIFPKGLLGFRRAPVDGLEALLDALVVAMGPHVPGIGTADVISTLTEEWKALRGDHLVRKGAVVGAAAQRRKAAKALRERLFKNMLVLAADNAGRPEACRLHFAQHLLGQGGAG